jgi:sec-independent protein translocase protein TatA
MDLFGIGPLELLVIAMVALLIFGPKKLPELAQTLGKTMRSLKDASRDFERDIKREFEPPAATTHSLAVLEEEAPISSAPAPAETPISVPESADSNQPL